MLIFIGLWTLVVYARGALGGSPGLAGGRWARWTLRAARWCTNAGVAGWCVPGFWAAARGMGASRFEPYNLGLTMAGAGMLWVGWFGFNAGSAVAADGRAGLAMAVTHLAAAAGALSWMLGEWVVRGPVAAGAVLRPGGGAGGHHTRRRFCHAALGRRDWSGGRAGLLLGRHGAQAAAAGG